MVMQTRHNVTLCYIACLLEWKLNRLLNCLLFTNVIIVISIKLRVNVKLNYRNNTFLRKQSISGNRRKWSILITEVFCWKFIDQLTGNFTFFRTQRRNVAVASSWMCLVSRCLITWTVSCFQSLQTLTCVSDIRKWLKRRSELNKQVSPFNWIST